MDVSKILCGVDIFTTPETNPKGNGSTVTSSTSSTGNWLNDFYHDYILDEKTKKVNQVLTKAQLEEQARKKKEMENKMSEEERLKKIKEHLAEADRIRMEEEEKKKKSSIFSIPTALSRQGSSSNIGTTLGTSSPPSSPGVGKFVPTGSPPSSPLAPVQKQSSIGGFFSSLTRPTSPRPEMKKQDSSGSNSTPTSPGKTKRSNSAKREGSLNKDAIATVSAEETKDSLPRQNSKQRVDSPSPLMKKENSVDQKSPVIEVTRKISFKDKKEEILPGW